MSARIIPAKEVQHAQLKVVILCEDLASGRYAKEVQDQLSRPLAPLVEFLPEAWTFRALQHPELRELAAAQVHDPDLILFSTRGEKELPPLVMTWLEEELARPGRPRALVALFTPSDSARQAPAIRASLQKLALRRKSDFFVDNLSSGLSRPTLAAPH